MKYALITLAAAFTLSAHASTQPIFAADGSKASVFISGLSASDEDAKGLFDALSAPAQDINGKLSKRFNFDKNGARPLSVTCVMSKVVMTSGTCTVIINSTEGTVVDKNAGVARYIEADGPEASRLAANFLLAPSSTPLITVYVSRDQRLAIHAHIGDDGRTLRSFSIEYQ